ncbi:thioesterase II family protein [Aliikangiella maris]|uniref:Thioesterase domain-containing protein n=2 Tax=Aliikangiella maris TaxID=3162458 RepID=A0ABV2BWG5_9GAMM
MNQPRRIIYAFSHAGASASSYQPWINQLASDSLIRFIPLERAGRGKLIREKTFASLSELSKSLADYIYQDFQHQQPKGVKDWITFGHSFGGVLSFAVTNILQKLYKLTPTYSIISGSLAPSIQQPDDMHLWSDKKILERAKADSATPDKLLANPSFAKVIINQLRADYTIREQFLNLKSCKVNQPFVLFNGTRDPHVSMDMIKAWQNHTTSQTRLIEIEGGHFSIYQRWDLVYQACLKNLIEPPLSVRSSMFDSLSAQSATQLKTHTV